MRCGSSGPSPLRGVGSSCRSSRWAPAFWPETATGWRSTWARALELWCCTSPQARCTGWPRAERPASTCGSSWRRTGELEYYPGLGIPYPDAEIHQRTEVLLSPGSRFGWFEIWTTGRTARGEHLAFRALRTETAIYAGGGPVYRDVLVLVPGRDPLEGAGLLEGARYVASGFWRWGDAVSGPGVT